MNKKSIRRDEANKRAEQRSQLTPQQQLDVLDKRLGVGVGAKKEREKLNKLIANMQK